MAITRGCINSMGLTSAASLMRATIGIVLASAALETVFFGFEILRRDTGSQRAIGRQRTFAAIVILRFAGRPKAVDLEEHVHSYARGAKQCARPAC